VHYIKKQVIYFCVCGLYISRFCNSFTLNHFCEVKEVHASCNLQILKRNQSLTLFQQHQNLLNWLGALSLDLISTLMHSEVRQTSIFCNIFSHIFGDIPLPYPKEEHILFDSVNYW
jgi:hypothetical protein